MSGRLSLIRFIESSARTVQVPVSTPPVLQTGPVLVREDVRGIPSKLNDPEGPDTEEYFAPSGLIRATSAWPDEPPREFASKTLEEILKETASPRGIHFPVPSKSAVSSYTRIDIFGCFTWNTGIFPGQVYQSPSFPEKVEGDT